MHRTCGIVDYSVFDDFFPLDAQAQSPSLAAVESRNVAAAPYASSSSASTGDDLATSDHLVLGHDVRCSSQGRHSCRSFEGLQRQQNQPYKTVYKVEADTELLALLCNVGTSCYLPPSCLEARHSSQTFAMSSVEDTLNDLAFAEKPSVIPIQLPHSDFKSTASEVLTHADKELTLFEHYSRLKKQRQCTEADISSHASSQQQLNKGGVGQQKDCQPRAASLPQKISSESYANPARSRHMHQETAKSQPAQRQNIESPDVTPKTVGDGESLEKIFEHPWVASHLKDLTRCFASGKAQEHMAHLTMLDVVPKSLTTQIRTDKSSPMTAQTGRSSMTKSVVPSEQNVPESRPQTTQPTARPIRQASIRRQLKYADFEQPETLAQLEAILSKDSGLKQQQSTQRLTQQPAGHLSEDFLLGSEIEEEASDFDCEPLPNRRRKQHNPWSLEETMALLQGVEDCGGGKWADIKKRNYAAIQDRSAVDLKDKWRNLVRVAVSPAADSRGKGAKRRELPLDVIAKVRKLHTMHNKSASSRRGTYHHEVATQPNTRSKRLLA